MPRRGRTRVFGLRRAAFPFLFFTAEGALEEDPSAERMAAGAPGGAVAAEAVSAAVAAAVPFV